VVAERRTTHECPGGCRRQVPRHRYACRTCWYRLPGDLRTAITDTYRRDPAAHRTAMLDAGLWYLNNPREARRG
jgi:hypothetical protein